MVRGWDRDPRAHLTGAQTGISAALWQGNDDQVEVFAKPDASQHIVSVQLNSFFAEMFVDHKPHYRRRHAAGSSSIVRAGEFPRAIVHGRWDILHMYVPTALVSLIVEAETSVSRVGELELICHRGTPDPQIALLGSQIIAEAGSALPFSRLRVDALGHELVIHLLRARSNLAARAFPKAGGCLAPWQLSRAREILEDRSQVDVSLATLASAVGLSPFYFSRAFKLSTGMPPHRYLLQKRIDKARELLEGTDLPVSEIAAQVGYDDPSYLARLFRREVGLTPAAYRRKRRC